MLDYFKTLCTLRVQYMAQSPSRASLCDADNLYKKYDPFKQKRRAPNGKLCLQTKFFCFTKRRENRWEAAVHPTNARHTATIWLVNICLARNSNLLLCTLVCSLLRSFVRIVSRLEAWLLSLENIWFFLRIAFLNPWRISGNTRDFSQTWVEQLMIPFPF